MNPALLLTLAAFWRTRRRAKHLRTRQQLIGWQAKRLARFLKDRAPRAEAFADLAGRPLTDFPVMDKAQLMGAFDRYNIAGITGEVAWSALETSGRIDRFSIGASTGTSGNRGLYLVSDAERYLWLGTLLAKALPDMLHARHRVAVLLPRGSRLYDAANESGRLTLKFLDLTDGLETCVAAAAAFRPDVLVAPPHALVAIAKADLPFHPRHVFSGAEVLDPSDRRQIEARFRLVMREIYMATEGLFGVACEHGTLHLCEDCVAFEWEGQGDLTAPIVTDFTRRSQLMIRYRMNDLLRLSDVPCPCGSPLQAVAEIAGRCDDMFELASAEGGRVTFTPDVIRNAVIGADKAISDFRVIQTGPDQVRLILPPHNTGALDAATVALKALFLRAGAKPEIIGAVEEPPRVTGAKLRRVMRAVESTA